VDTKGYGGRTLSKTIHAYTNDSEHRVIHFKISGPVEEFVSISPSYIRFRGTVGSTPQKEEVRIIPGEKYSFNITGIHSAQGRDISYKYEPAKFSGKRGYRLLITCNRDKPGTFSDRIYLKTDSKFRPELEVRVHGSIFRENNKNGLIPEQQNRKP